MALFTIPHRGRGAQPPGGCSLTTRKGVRMLTPDELTDRVIGCVLGGAVGDALGAPFEGYWPRDLPRKDLLLSGFAEVEGYPRGQYTDDTQLTVASLKSVVRRGCIDPADVA